MPIVRDALEWKRKIRECKGAHTREKARLRLQATLNAMLPKALEQYTEFCRAEKYGDQS